MNIAINGFGRIGKQFLLACFERGVRANFFINHPGSLDHMVYALKFDSVHPSISNVRHDGKSLFINSKKIPVSHQLDPRKIPHRKNKIDIVVEATGLFRKRKDASLHLRAGAKKVLITAPSDDCDVCAVFGVNHNKIQFSDKIISAASCTTNCLVPLVKVLHDNFGVLNGLFVTTHAYTTTQGLIDRDDHKDMRRGRAAGVNIVPTSSGAAISAVKILPELNGLITGYALRVPVADGSITNFTAKVSKVASVDEINAVFKRASKGMNGVLEFSSDPLVSSDIVHNPHSCVFDSGLTRVSGDLVSVAGWYDNEWGYVNRLVDLLPLMK